MIRPHRWLWLLLPVLLGADCPGVDHMDHRVRIHVLPAGVPSSIRPPAITETMTVRFRQDTATHDVVVDEGVTLGGYVLAPSVDAGTDPEAEPTVGTAALLLGREQDGRARFTAHADDQGMFSVENLAPGTYDLTVFADEFVGQYGATYLELELPGQELIDVPLEYGHLLQARVAEFDLITRERIGIGSMAVDVFEELEDGELRHAGPRATTDADGDFSLYLPEGTYTLRVASPSYWPVGDGVTEPIPFPTGLVTGFRVPGDIERLEADAAAEGLEVPFFYTYPRFRRASLSGTVRSVGPFNTGQENNAEVSVWGVVRAPSEYEGLEEVDFVLGPIERKVFTNDSGDFAFGAEDEGLPAAVYSMDVIPGFDSDGSAQRWTGDQAIDLTDGDRQLGDVDLTARVDFWVSVTDQQNRPVEGARVELHNLGLSRYSTALHSDENGVALFDKTEQGPHRVLVFAPAGEHLGRSAADLEVGTATQVHFAVLEPGIRVTGQVAEGFELLEGVMVRFYDPEDGTLLGEGRTGRSGTYEIDVPKAWAWPELDDDAGDDDSAE